MIKICEDFELRAVQRCGNRVEFEKRCKMTIWTQKSALIQLRTSLLKFDDLAENFEISSVSNLSTKVYALQSPGINDGEAPATSVERVAKMEARAAAVVRDALDDPSQEVQSALKAP